MKHFIVNIGCEYGSGGPDIGKMVAESPEKKMSNMNLTQPLDQDMRILQTVLFTHSLRLFINWRQNHLVSLSEDVVTIY